MNIMPTTLFSALSHEMRLRCVLLLQSQGELCVCDLTEITGDAQPNISRHLRQLREAGLVLDRRDGLWVHYRINPELPAWVDEMLVSTAQVLARQQPFLTDSEALADRMALVGRCAADGSTEIR